MVIIFRWTTRLPLLILAIVSFARVSAFWTECEIIGVENSKSGVLQTDYRIKRINKVTFAVEGSLALTENCDYDYECEIKLWYSSKGNNQYKLLPYRVPREKCCKTMETTYWQAIHKELEKVSNIPKKNPEADSATCLYYVKGNYTVHGFTFDQNILPKFLNAGTYRAEMLIYVKNSTESNSRSAFLARLF